MVNLPPGVHRRALELAVQQDRSRSAWSTAPGWFHGDVPVRNLPIAEGQLSAVIDFGTCGIGDPACDLVIAWTFLRGNERQVFRLFTIEGVTVVGASVPG